VWQVSFSPDGKWLLSSGNDDSVSVWEVVTGKEVLKRVGHVGRVYHGQFGPDGRTGLSAGVGLTVLLSAPRPGEGPPLQQVEGRLWDDLSSDDGARAYRSVWALADEPQAAAAFLRAKLPAVKLDVPRERVAALIAGLDDPVFRSREAATKALAELGP